MFLESLVFGGCKYRPTWVPDLHLSALLSPLPGEGWLSFAALPSGVMETAPPSLHPIAKAAESRS